MRDLLREMKFSWVSADLPRVTVHLVVSGPKFVTVRSASEMTPGPPSTGRTRAAPQVSAPVTSCYGDAADGLQRRVAGLEMSENLLRGNERPTKVLSDPQRRAST